MKNVIIVKISGEIGSGKSKLAEMISKLIEKEGQPNGSAVIIEAEKGEQVLFVDGNKIGNMKLKSTRDVLTGE